MRDRLNIVVAATIASVPEHAGWTWAVLQYVLGLRRLGHRVHLIDPIQSSSISPTGPLAASANARYFESVIERFGIDECSTLVRVDESETLGQPVEAVRTMLRDADLLIDVSGSLSNGALLGVAKRSVYLDVDPVFTQVWATEGVDVGLDGHTHFVTIGWNIGTPDAVVPSAGKTWIPTLQPVVLDWWDPKGEVTCPALTTVANWRGYGSVEYGGVFFGQKAHSLRQFIDLPRRTAEPFVLALAIDPAEVRDLAALQQNGWQLIDPAGVSRTTDDYQRFIRGSKAEFGIAKSGYVAAQCGWFSDRSICYLASGRPVLAHDTGLDGLLPTAEGIIAFSTEDDVLRGIDDLNADYPRHARAARAIAEEYFDSDRVLARLLDRVSA